MPLTPTQLTALENELLLSKGGGIYYENARVEAAANEATLFIGLGGTGADMLIRIKNEVKRRMVLPQIEGRIASDTPNNIGFLAIDTDANSAKKAWGTATFDPFGSEFCSIAVGDKQAMVVRWKQLLENKSPEAQWYEGIDAVAALPGAGGIRQIGRMMLFENIRSTKERIQSKIRQIRAGGINKVNVIVVAGIAGGTGSGTFIDIAYLSRAVLEEEAVIGRNVFGYIVLPDVNLLNGGQEDSLKRNGFAALKELDYWMSPGSAEHDDQFAQNYGPTSVRSVAAQVFNFCHLLSAHDMNGVPLTYNKVISSMAENVFAYIAGEVMATTDGVGNTAMSSMYDNIDLYIKELAERAPIPACYRYLAVGSHKLEIPFSEISTLLAVRLFERLNSQNPAAPGVFTLRPTEETFNQDMARLQLTPRVVSDSLMNRVQPSPLEGNPNYQHGQIWAPEGQGHRQNRAYNDAYQWLAVHYQPTVKQNAANWAHEQNGIFLTYLMEAMKSPYRGPMYLAALIKSDSKWSIIPTLTNLAQHCDDVANTCASMQNEIEQHLHTAWNNGSGKMFNKQKYVNEYLGALFAWLQNDMSMFIYPHRAKALRDLRDQLQLYYDKIFSKLTDVLEALPSIFKQNLDKIEIDQRNAERDGKLDDTYLIWPLKFENEHNDKFNQMLDAGIKSFLESMTENINKWTGMDLERLDANATNTDVPGFISKFVSDQFGNLLNINMEDIMKSKEGTDNLEAYLRRTLQNLRDRSVPMFSMNQTYRNTSTAEFGLVSVPQDCIETLNVARNHVVDSKVSAKTSKEKTRLYFVKVVSGIPLYAYSKIEDMDATYELARGKETGKGIHLVGGWRNTMPTPLPEAAWTPGVYTNHGVKELNDQIRTAFDFCLENGVIRPDPTEPKRLLLYIADENKANADLTFGDHLSLEDQIEAITDVRKELWGARNIPLMAIGKWGGEDNIVGVKESVLRLPKVANEIIRQAEVVKQFAERIESLDDPRVFADSLIAGLTVKQGFNIVFKRSLNSLNTDLLFTVNPSITFGEYEAFATFKSRLDKQRRSDIKLALDEMIQRIMASPEELETLKGRIEEITKTYGARLPEIRQKIEGAASDKRKQFNDIFTLYNAVVKTAEKYLNTYFA